MKFGWELSQSLTPEWRAMYIAYDYLKRSILNPLDEASKISDKQKRELHLRSAEAKFFDRCDDDLRKVNLFFHEKLAENIRTQRRLHRNLDFLPKAEPRKFFKLNFKFLTTKSVRYDQENEPDDDETTRENLNTKECRQLKNDYKEYYLSLILLQNYKMLNQTGFKKILKKHDKKFGNTRGAEWKKNHVDTADFVTDGDVENLIRDVENEYIDKLEGGDRKKAMSSLRVPPLRDQQQPAATSFQLGIFIGMSVVVFIVTVISALSVPGWWDPPWVALRLFRGLFILFANTFLMGLSMFVWETTGVNHVLIFEINPRKHLKYQDILTVGAALCTVWGMCLLGYIYAPMINMPRLIFPLVLVGTCFIWLINPLPFFMRVSRFWFLHRLFRCVMAPFYRVDMAAFWLADQMCSLVTVILDLEYLICFYAYEVEYGGEKHLSIRISPNSTYVDNQWAVHRVTGADVCATNVNGIRPLLAVLPLFIRFMQCCRRYYDSRNVNPHIYNVCKYGTTMSVVFFGSLNTLFSDPYTVSPFFDLWLYSYLASYAVTYFWDVKIDWGLFDKNRGDNRWLREELIYKKPAYYYAAILANLLLRLSWVLNVSLGDAWLEVAHADVLITVTALLEVIRRCVWNLIRLENEHLNNVGQFRAVRDISIKPWQPTDVDDLDDVVDESKTETPPKKRKTKKSKKNAKKTK